MSSQSSFFNSVFIPWVWFGAKFAGGIVAFALVMLYRNQDKILYHPSPPGFPKIPSENPDYFRSPSEWTIKGHPKKIKSDESIPYEEVYVETSDGEKLHCWLLLQPGQSASVPTLVYFHGNAGNMGFRLRNAAEMYAHIGINVLMVDYRGYGLSTGVPNEVGLNRDADAVLNFLVHNRKLKGSPLVLFGRSLGGAVAISLAHRYPDQVHGIIVENTFRSISSMVDKLMPAVSFLKSLVLRIGWNSDELISSLTHPIMFISGDSDELVPPLHMKQLYELASKSVHRDFFSVLGGTHNDTWDRAGKKYYSRMSEFFEKVIEVSQQKNSCSNDSSNSCSSYSSSHESVSEKEDNIDENVEKVHIPTMSTHFQVK